VADYSFITERVAIGGGIWTKENFAAIRRAGFTHIVNTQVEFDDATLRDGDAGPEIFWLPVDDDFQPKPAEFFRCGVRYALQMLNQPDSLLLIHCASGVHRAPLLALALLRVLGFTRRDAVFLLRARRPQVDFPDVYLESVDRFFAEWQLTTG
jgi:protein-tyrosine phosphatase